MALDDRCGSATFNIKSEYGILQSSKVICARKLFFATLQTLMYNEYFFYLKKKCFDSISKNFCGFSESINFKIGDVIIHINAHQKLHF